MTRCFVQSAAPAKAVLPPECPVKTPLPFQTLAEPRWVVSLSSSRGKTSRHNACLNKAFRLKACRACHPKAYRSKPCHLKA